MPRQKLWPRDLDGNDPDDPAYPIALNNFKQISRGWETESGLYEQLWQSQKQEEKNLMMELRDSMWTSRRNTLAISRDDGQLMGANQDNKVNCHNCRNKRNIDARKEIHIMQLIIHESNSELIPHDCAIGCHSMLKDTIITVDNGHANG